MNTSTVWDHVLDILKGTLGAMLTAACLAGLNYLGAHIPDLINAISSIAGGVAAIKGFRRA